MPAGDEMTSMNAPDAIPLYEQVKREISEAILQGEWAAGAVLPGEVALAEQFSVAVGTIRRALADLTSDGMLTRRQRTGTIVTGRMPQHSMRLYYQYFRLHRSDGTLVRSKTKVLDVVMSAAKDQEAAAFSIEIGAPLVRIHRVRSVEGEAVMHERVNLPASRIPGFATRADDVPELLYLHILERYDIRISAVREVVSAESPKADDMRLLGVPPRSAVLVVDSSAFDQSDRLCIMSNHRAVTRNFKYVNEVR